jgi:bile acid:Na+ symporter, BASS family
VIVSASLIARKVAAYIPDALPALSLAAAALAWLAPSAAIASRVDILLAALVLVTALDIDTGQLLAVLARWRLVLLLAAAPLPVLAAGSWVLGETVHGATRTGVIALGLSPTEVASVGLIGLMAGPAEVAIAVLACSLVLSAVLGSPLLTLLAGGAHASALPLLGRFALVVLVPLGAGLLARDARPELARHQGALSTLSSLLVVALIYASLSGTHGAGVGTAIAVSAAFLALSALIAASSLPVLRRGIERSLALTIGMRDFAVAAALASAAGGTGAARVAGVYGVLMLLVGATITGMVRRRSELERAPVNRSV